MGSKEEKKAKSEKYNVFMGTLMICVVYAVIALLMAVVFYFTEAGKEFDKSLGTFTRTFIVGAILVTIILTVLVFEWTPDEAIKQKKDVMKPTSCPDYWELKHTEDNNITDLLSKDDNIKSVNTVLESGDTTSKKLHVDNVNIIHDHSAVLDNNDNYVDYNDFKITDGNKNKLRNKCVADQNMFDSLNSVNYNNSTTGNNNMTVKNKNTLLAGFNAMYNNELILSNGTVTQPSINCNEVYPEYLADLDAKEYAKNDYTGATNKYRCEYSKICGVPWSSIGC